MTLPLFYDCALPALQVRIRSFSEPAYRAGQIWRSVYQKLVDDPQQITEIPAALRTRLAAEWNFRPLEAGKILTSSDGHTWKYLFRLPDGAPVETVRMAYDRRETVCISTQSGCGMGCSFCATGRMGLRRSLTGGEIAAQAFAIARQLQQTGAALTNIVLMGMGEPFVNLDAVLESIALLSHPDGFRFGARRMTVSTVGVIPGIRRFALEAPQVNLAVSLHAADDATRVKLIPLNEQYPLQDLFAACEEYIRLTRRRISFEWAMMEGVNDSRAQAERLALRITAMENPLVHVNLIPLNPIRGVPNRPSTPDRIDAFRTVMEDNHITCTVRVRRGLDIAAGCGQLVTAGEAAGKAV